jgi:hypothetical protein
MRNEIEAQPGLTTSGDNPYISIALIADRDLRWRT